MRASEPAHVISVVLPKLANWLITVSHPFPVNNVFIVYVWCASASFNIVVLYTATHMCRGTHRPYGGDATTLKAQHSIHLIFNEPHFTGPVVRNIGHNDAVAAT